MVLLFEKFQFTGSNWDFFSPLSGLPVPYLKPIGMIQEGKESISKSDFKLFSFSTLLIGKK